jgi:hypothetical protein
MKNTCCCFGADQSVRALRPRIRNLVTAFAAAFAFAAPALAADTDFSSAVSNYFDTWQDRVKAAQESQPSWITPLATTTPRLEQEFRYGSHVDIYDSGKGFEFIPTERTEVIIATPAYQVRRPEAAASGWADWPGILIKYRLISANKAHGDYIVSIFAQYGLPTGANVFTSHNHVFTPTLAVGKGFGDFDIQATIGEAFPTDDHSHAGKSVLTNVTAQYHFAKYFWPEVEMNRTDWVGGARDARSQTYLTPGIIFGRFILPNKMKLILGVGYQTPLSHNYPQSPATPTFNHNWLTSVRLAF